MSIQSADRRMPEHLAVPLALPASARVARTLGTIGGATPDFLLGGDGILAFFAAPSIAVLGFVSCFSILINRRPATSWRTPTFAVAMAAILVWVWGHDFGGIGFAWYVPGATVWLVSCCSLHRRWSAQSEHVIEA